MEVVEKSIGTCYLKMPKTVILLEQESEKMAIKMQKSCSCISLTGPKASVHYALGAYS